MDGDGFAAADFDGLNFVGLVAACGDAQAQLHIRLFIRAQIGYPKHRPAVGIGDRVLVRLESLVLTRCTSAPDRGLLSESYTAMQICWWK